MTVTFGSKPVILEMPDGAKFHCATLEQAAAMYRLMKEPHEPTPAQQLSDLSRGTVRHRVRSAPSVAEEVKEKLKPYDGKEIGANEMVTIFGVESPNGVGTKLRHLRAALEAEGVDIDELARPRKASDGTMRWQIAVSEAGKHLADRVDDFMRQ